MRFIDQGKKRKGSEGAYVVVLCLVLLSLFIGASISQFLTTKLGGFHLDDENYNVNTMFAIQLLPFLVVFLVMLIAVKYVLKQPLISVFTSRPKFDWKRFLTAFSIWLGFLIFFLVVLYAFGDPIELQFNTSRFIPLLIISCTLLPIQTMAEDLLFRGILFQGLGGILRNGVVVIAILAVLFGLLHAGNPEIQLLGYGVLLYYILSGLFLGLITHFDDGLELGMGYHFANNFFGAVIITNSWQAFQTDAILINHAPPAITWEIILTPILFQPLLIFIFFKLYKWKGLREKLGFPS